MKFVTLAFLSIIVLTGCDQPAPYGASVHNADVNISIKQLKKRISENITPLAPEVRQLATKLSSLDPSASINTTGDLNKAAIIHAYLCSNWKYVKDPSLAEYVASPSETISSNFAGDCDDFSILLASLLEAIGIETRVNIAFSSSNGGHAFVEARFYGKEQVIDRLSRASGLTHFKIGEGDSVWVNFDWTGDIPGGEFFKSDYGWIYYTQKDKWISY